MAADRVGQQLGNYRLLRLLGEGGFAEVYLGEHVYLNSQAAIKVLHTRLGKDDQEVFLSEARTIVRLKHLHIVRVLDFGLEGTTPFLVMDYAPQGTLRERHPRGIRLPLETIQPYVRQVADALQYAHELKFIHRDIKPENMLVGERGEVLLSDFGIATIAQSTRYQQTEAVAGTAAYMAPEQFQGKPRPASDQYSLGIVIYEWLTGTLPFHGSFLEISGQHLHLPPPPLREKLPSLLAPVEEVVLTALAKDPKERFGSIQAFATAFEAACQDSGLFFAPTMRSSWPPTSAPPLITPTPVQPTPPGASHLPPTSVVPPANRPNGDSSGPSSPASIPVSQPAPPNTYSLATPKPVTLARTEEQMQTKRGLSRRKVLVAAGALVGLAALGGGMAWWATSFHQQVSTGPHVPEIHTGTGYDTTGRVTGESDTFRQGQEVFLVFSLVSSGPIDGRLLLGSTEQVGAFHLLNADKGTHGESQRMERAGVYKWEIDYDGNPEAGITFQVVSDMGV